MIIDLATYTNQLTKRIDEIFDTEISHSKKFGNFMPEHLEYFHKLSTTNGKKLRGYLVYLGSMLFSTEEINPDEILTLSAAMEIFHTSLLIHDDIEDDSDLRRGMKTMHKYEDDKYSSRHLGISLGIDMGDCGLFLSIYLISSINSIQKEDIAKILEIFTRISIDLGYGQAYDLISNIGAADNLSLDEILKICNLKTGTYTFLLPLQIGIMQSGNSDKISKIEDFAYNSGIVYQLTDDLLDIFSDPLISGKANCGDIREGKINGIIKTTLDKANEEDKKYIISILGKKDSDIDTEKVRDIIKSSGAYEEISSLIDKYTSGALESINKINASEESKTILGGIVSSLKAREK